MIENPLYMPHRTWARIWRYMWICSALILIGTIWRFPDPHGIETWLGWGALLLTAFSMIMEDEERDRARGVAS